MLEKFSISRSEKYYQAWPDVVLLSSGKLICVFAECLHHDNRNYTRIRLIDSIDRGRTWYNSRPLTEDASECDYYYNCPRISLLPDGFLYILVDRIPKNSDEAAGKAEILSFVSHDGGGSWSEPEVMPLNGIVPDRLTVSDSGRRFIAAHRKIDEKLAEFLIYSDDGGKNWSHPIVVAKSPEFNLCEVSLLPMGNGVIAAFFRENSGKGYDCKKALSFDDGATWGELSDFPLPGCHRPVAGKLQNGMIFITFRFMQGGKGWLGNWTQNFMGAFTDRESVLAGKREECGVRIFPLDFDRSPYSDLGYSGHVQFPDGEIYVVNYIVDDAWDKAQIRGYSFRQDDFLLSCNPQQNNNIRSIQL